jgi:hypothetical protein
MKVIKTFLIVVLLCGFALPHTRFIDGPQMAQTLWAKQGMPHPEFVIINTLSSMEGETSPVGEICASEWTGVKFDLDEISCHDAISFPTPQQLK